MIKPVKQCMKMEDTVGLTVTKVVTSFQIKTSFDHDTEDMFVSEDAHGSTTN